MATRERLYERKLNKPLNDKKKAIVSEVVQKRLGNAVLRQEWSATAPSLTVTTQHVTFIISFDGELMALDAEYSWLARFLVTEENRRMAREMAESMADEAGL